MIQLFNAANIFSKLASNSSLLPIAVKDGAHSVGMTTASYITGKEVEGKDRFIDEFGTQAIWIGGIPAYKKLIDYTIYKIAKQDPHVDVRILKDKKILEAAKKHAAESIKANIEMAEKHSGTFKGLALTKFIASTLLTLGSYWALTNFRHKHTEKSLIKQIQQEEAAKKAKTANQTKINTQKPAFKQHNPSFGMNMKALEDFMFNPVKNMMIVDGGITAERLSESRNPQDFMGYVIKEGAFWGFMYLAGSKIQEYFEKASAKNGKPIDLDIKVLQNHTFIKSLLGGKIKGDLDKFNMTKEIDEIVDGKPVKKIISKTDEEIYEMLFKEGATTGTMNDNLVVKMAKKSGFIQTIKGNDNLIDTRHHIDIEGIKGLKNKMEAIMKESTGHNKKELKSFLKEIIKLKRLAIAKNIGACVMALGIVVPGAMLAMRYMDKDNKEFAVKKQLHEKMKQNNLV